MPPARRKTAANPSAKTAVPSKCEAQFVPPITRGPIQTMCIVAYERQIHIVALIVWPVHDVTSPNTQSPSVTP